MPKYILKIIKKDMQFASKKFRKNTKKIKNQDLEKQKLKKLIIVIKKW